MSCNNCHKVMRKDHLERHKESCIQNSSSTSSNFKCECGKAFTRKADCARHKNVCKAESCLICQAVFYNHHNYERHQKFCGLEPKAKMSKTSEPKVGILLAFKPDEEEYESGFDCRIKSFFLRSNENSDLPTFLENVKDRLKEKLENHLDKYGNIKFSLHVDSLMKKEITEDELETGLKTRNIILTQKTQIEEEINKCFYSLKTELEELQTRGSGWTLKAIDGIRLKINKYIPLRGGVHIELPKSIQNKNCCINVQNNDGKCFQYSMLSKFVTKPHPERVGHYTDLNHQYNFDMTSSPTQLHEIKKFEKANNCSINIFGLDKYNKVYPLQIMKEEQEDHTDLLLLHDEKEEKSHYVFIKDFGKLVGSQLSKHHGRKIICKRCFSYFNYRYNGEEKFKEHKELCKNNEAVKVKMPLKKPYMTFENPQRRIRVPYCLYADWEVILVPIQGASQNPAKSYTDKTHNHIPMSFGVYLKVDDDVKGIDESLPTEPYLYRGLDAVSQFVKYIKNLGIKIMKIYEKNEPMTALTEEQEQLYSNATTCYVCEKNFTLENHKVHDHSHITGLFRGASCNECNLKNQAPNFLPIFIHNLKYDSHLIIKELACDEEDIDVIAENNENYISFSKRIGKNFKLRFLDTFRFMASSLDKLASNLPDLKETSKFFTEDLLEFVKRKGVFPYEYVTSWNQLNDESLPPIEKFYSSLKMEGIEPEQYTHAQNVWKAFNCKNLGEYSDLYLKTDVLLLSDIFENFRHFIGQSHKLDPAHYYTAPGLSFDAMLRHTNVKLDLLTDYDMLMMVEAGIRGGICQASHRYLEANNPLSENYDPRQPNKWIVCQDSNNLYGLALSKPLPYSNFEWVEDPSIIDVEKLNEEDEVGYILEVDIDYPNELHDIHNDLPFLAENIKVGRQRKLVPHLGNRRKYVVHYMTLKQAIKHGLILVKIHRAIKFNQSNWLKPYVDLNTELRKKAKNEFEKDLYKLLNNAVFGKTIESLRKRKNISLVCNAKKLEKMISSPLFLSRVIFTEKLAAVLMAKKAITFNKPIYVGFCVLDLSKIVMYNYHYNVMLEKYGVNRLKLAYTDTDSFTYQILTDDIYNDMLGMMEHLDTSDYPTDHKCYSLRNKKVLGKFKDEAQGEVIEKFVALRAKMYSIKMKHKLIKKAKGVQKTAIKKSITFDDYANCLRGGEEMKTEMTSFRSFLHEISTIKLNKTSLSPYDDKRHILKDGITTLALGHFKISDTIHL